MRVEGICQEREGVSVLTHPLLLMLLATLLHHNLLCLPVLHADDVHTLTDIIMPVTLYVIYLGFGCITNLSFPPLE